MAELTCIIVDDEPLAREAMEILIKQNEHLQQVGSFNNALSAAGYIARCPVDLIFLDIQMPGLTGLEFARIIPHQTLVIFTTAYSEFALDSYEVEAIDYLIKPIESDRFQKAVRKALIYHKLLVDEKENIEQAELNYFFVKSERRYCKVLFDEILFIEGLKDYVIIQMEEQRIITKMNLKGIFALLPESCFFRINKSYIVNTRQITSFDNNDVFIRSYEIAIGNSYRDEFFSKYLPGI